MGGEVGAAENGVLLHGHGHGQRLVSWRLGLGVKADDLGFKDLVRVDAGVFAQDGIGGFEPDFVPDLQVVFLSQLLVQDHGVCVFLGDVAAFGQLHGAAGKGGVFLTAGVALEVEHVVKGFVEGV